MNLIFSNIASLAATLVDIFSASRKKARDLLLVQTVGQCLFGLSVLLVQSYSAAVQNAICIIRNLAAACKVKSRVLEWALVILAVVLGLCLNTNGWVGLLPILASLEYTLAIFHFKDREVPIKIAFAIHAVLYLIFDFLVKIYIGAISNCVLVITTMMFVHKSLQKKKKTTQSIP